MHFLAQAADLLAHFLAQAADLLLHFLAQAADLSLHFLAQAADALVEPGDVRPEPGEEPDHQRREGEEADDLDHHGRQRTPRPRPGATRGHP